MLTKESRTRILGLALSVATVLVTKFGSTVLLSCLFEKLLSGVSPEVTNIGSSNRQMALFLD